MSIVVCPNCGERVFTITGWADLDHCPQCGRVLAAEEGIARTVRDQIQQEAGKLNRLHTPGARRRFKPRPAEEGDEAPAADRKPIRPNPSRT